MVAVLNDIGMSATLSVCAAVERDAYGNDVRVMTPIALDNVFVYSGGGSSTGSVGDYLEVDRDATALLPFGTSATLDELVGGHSLAGATLEQGGMTYRVQGDPLPYPDGTSPYSWEWAVPLRVVTG